MSCGCAGRGCRRCRRAAPEPPPDGPDELLAAIATLEAEVARERARLDRTGGARLCRFCQGDVPPGTGAGVHEQCLPAALPEGARSCAACGELILDEDDEFEHDFCSFDIDSDDPFETPEEPTEPQLLRSSFELLPPGERDHQVEDAVYCPCGAYNPVTVRARFDPALLAGHEILSVARTPCRCGREVVVVWSWRRRTITSVHFVVDEPMN